MSLSELLVDRRASTTWSEQRRRLRNAMVGITVMLGGAVLLSLALGLRPRSRAPAAVVAAPAAMDQLKEQTELLRGKIKELSEAPPPAPPVRATRPIAFSRRGVRGYAAPILPSTPGEGFTDLKRAEVEQYVPTGAVFQARLLTPIKTSIDRTFVMAETTAEYRMDSVRLIPKGSRLIGHSRLNPVLKNVTIEFETLVLPSGIETPLTGLALSQGALPAIDGLYFSNRDVTYGTALAFGFLSGFSGAARTQQATALGPVPEVNVGNQALAGLSVASFQVANQIINDIRANATEYVVVPAGEHIFVVLTRRYAVRAGRPS